MGDSRPVYDIRTNDVRYGNIVILTGAGVSRESGLHTFRDADGIWSKVNLEDVATPQAFLRSQETVHKFYNARRRQLTSGDVQPNTAHQALALLQRQWTRGNVLLVTQNIDNLHERAGSTDVAHMHGELLKARCTHCQKTTQWIDDLNTTSPCPQCGTAGGMRPDVVWFGEMPMHMEHIERALASADLFLSVGTSGTVYPAAGFVEIARAAGAHTIELNLEESLGASSFHEGSYGPATIVVPQYVGRLLSRQKA